MYNLVNLTCYLYHCESQVDHFCSQLHTILQRHLHRKAVFKTSWESSYSCHPSEYSSSSHTWGDIINSCVTLLCINIPLYYCDNGWNLSRWCMGTLRVGILTLQKHLFCPFMIITMHVKWNNVELPYVELESRENALEKTCNILCKPEKGVFSFFSLFNLFGTFIRKKYSSCSVVIN